MNEDDRVKKVVDAVEASKEKMCDGEWWHEYLLRFLGYARVLRLGGVRLLSTADFEQYCEYLFH